MRIYLVLFLVVRKALITTERLSSPHADHTNV